MKETVPVAQAAIAQEAVLPVRVQEALGELLGAAQEGLPALGVGVGLGVMAELLEEEVTEAVGPRGKHDPDRSAVRHGHDSGDVTLGGRHVAVERPRVRTVDSESEVPLATYRHFADRHPLTRLLEQMLAGVSRDASSAPARPSATTSKREPGRPRSRRCLASSSRARARTSTRS